MVLFRWPLRNTHSSPRPCLFWGPSFSRPPNWGSVHQIQSGLGLTSRSFDSLGLGGAWTATFVKAPGVSAIDPGLTTLTKVSLGPVKLHGRSFLHSISQQAFTELLPCDRYCLSGWWRGVEMEEFSTLFKALAVWWESQTGKSILTVLRDAACERGCPGCLWNTNLPLYVQPWVLGRLPRAGGV